MRQFILIVALLVMVLLLVFLPSTDLPIEEGTEQSDEPTISEPIAEQSEDWGNLPSFDEDTITIANWNIEVFKVDKAKNAAMLDAMKKVISHYDVVFIQEIREPEAFDILCDALPEYACQMTARRGDQIEYYGLLSKIAPVDWIDHVGMWDRPPLEVSFAINDEIIKVYNIHLNGRRVKSEIAALADLAKDGIVIGDLNSDCEYYDVNNKEVFLDWKWLIPDGTRTTVYDSSCAFDRILLHKDMMGYYIDHGIHKQDISREMSDHYLIWVALEVE